MIHMQRSNSLPGPAYPSPPQSPSGLEIPTRTATPAAFGRSAQASWLRHDNAYAPLVRPSEPVRQDAQPTSANLDMDDVFKLEKEPRNMVPLVPIGQDISHHTNDQLDDAAPETQSTSLQELAHLVRLSAYQERKQSQSQVRLHRSLVSTGLSARLARCGELAHRTLVDNFRADEKKTFSNLYNAIHDVRSSCDANRRYALLEPDLDIGQSRSVERDEGTISTFMDELPSRSREVFLNFLCQVRTNPEFLATRISSLSPSEISALTASHQGLEPLDSVLPFHSRSKSHSQSSNRNSAHIPSSVERLLSFQRHDPLSALIHTCFANSAGPDSAEDLRRRDVWATVCARMITENRSGTDPFICSALNIWTAMRDWSGKSNMEWYLMKILEDGAFLLEKAEDQAGTRIHVEPRNAKDSIAVDGFYNNAVNGLFEIIDDPGAGGIPEGAIELGSAILHKLDPKKHSYAKGLLVSRWLFSVFLLKAVIHPEAYGMMSGYHITEYGRQKILKEVAIRAQRSVVELPWKQSTAISPEIRAHIENIMDQFRPARTPRTSSKLLPARSITSLRETAEVRPYLVLSSADLVTMVNALFPEKRTHSDSLDKDGQSTGLRSTASSISGMSGVSLPVSVTSQSWAGFDTPSVLSNSGPSTIFSEVTSREQAFDVASIATNRFSSTSISSMSQAPRFEDEGYKLRIAVRDMAQALGPDVISGSCHPCAEQWAVLFVSSGGKELSTQMIQANKKDEDTSGSDSEVEVENSTSDLDEEFQLLRDPILKLVEDYEIPQSLDKDNEFKFFSNITTSLNSPKTKHHIRQKASSQGLETKSKYSQNHGDAPRRPKQHRRPPPSHRQSSRPRSSSREQQEASEHQQSILLDMLEAAEIQCSAQSDFVNAHIYWKTSQQLRQLSPRSLKENGFVSLLNIFSTGPRDSIRRSTSAIEEYEAWMVWLRQSQERLDLMIEKMMRSLNALRDKMWYASDVRNSAPYESARNVAVALKSMAAMKNNRYLSANGGRPRNVSRSSVNNFLLKTEAQIVDILAASEEHGGPNKLSDEQSDKTVKWLSQYGIENFCKGEERIHRFCMEIETCVSRLVGDSLTEGPVLWSSDLFQRDKGILDSGRQKGDLILTNLGTLSISDDSGRDNDVGRRRLRSVEMATTARSPQRDLRSMATRNGSQKSFDSSRWSMVRSSISGDFADYPDYFGTASPVLAIDSATTFWSPLQARVKSPSTSIGSFRSESASTSETLMFSNLETTGTVTKNKFLSDLKQSLLSLLISDLGMLLFAKGSETDSWFSGKLGHDCVEWSERHEKKQKKKLRVIEKRKSFHDLRSAQKTDFMASQQGEAIEPKLDQEHTTTVISAESPTLDLHLSLDSSQTSDTTRASSPRKLAIRKSSIEFPFKVAFKRLLQMFSVHPNPYAKLNALFEIEHLIVASLTSASPKFNKGLSRDDVRSQSRAYNSYPTSQEEELSGGQAKTADNTIENCNKRRSQFIYHGNLPSQSNKRFTVASPASTDAIVEVLQGLLREFDIRPKTLFRDLQFIAAFVPASILDKTGHGKAFWDTGLAALALKQDVCRTLIEIADEIVLHYTQTRQASSLNTVQPNVTLDSEQEVVRYTMQDAARMWTITAKEGDAVAERELAIFYLTHPELVERTTLPLTRPRETFKATVMEMHAGGGEGDRERSDPATMCVAYHWMELSALGGDELAKKYLRQREELNALP